ncbi:histidine kinase [Peribacillus frigoritolerans]|nr:histidine kinase [Peribacillus frigoritolerans]
MKHINWRGRPKIRALQAQINPHFLFQCLEYCHIINEIDQNKAREMLLSLSQYFRQNLAGTTKEWITLSEEIQHVQSYANIEKNAVSSINCRLRIALMKKWCRQKIPPLTLQPLIENAIHHGFKNKTEKLLDYY